MSGGGGSAPSQTTQITRTEPPEYVKPYSIELMERAGALSQSPYEPYDYQRTADLTDQHMSALGMTQDRALSGSPTMNLAQANAQGSLDNSYLNNALSIASQQNPWMGDTNPYAGENPYLQSMIDKAQGDVVKQYENVTTPQLAAAERASGAFGNSGLQQMKQGALDDLGENLGDISSGMRFQNYINSGNLAGQDIARNAMLAEQQKQSTLGAFNNERTNQMRAMGFAPQMAEIDYRDAQALLGVGDIIRGENQAALNERYDTWQQAQNWPYQQMDVLANAIRTSMGGGGSSVTSAPNAYQSSPVAGMIGGGMAGYGIGQALDASNPMLYAAGGGLLGSLF